MTEERTRTSVESLGPLLARGRTAEIYIWEEGYILKLFRERFPRSAIERESRIARIVHKAGPPAPAVGNIIEVDGRYGLIYERVAGVSMLEIMTSKPWTLFQHARLLAELQAAVHRTEAVEGLPSQSQKLRDKIREAKILPPHLQETALSRLEELPEGDHLCHGDFHPDNVLITGEGPVIIDWHDATRGSPLADVARSSLLMSHAPPSGDKSIRWLLNLFRRWFHRAYLRHYFQLRPGGREELAPWRIVNAAGRLSEKVPEKQALLALVQAGWPR